MSQKKRKYNFFVIEKKSDFHIFIKREKMYGLVKNLLHFYTKIEILCTVKLCDAIPFTEKLACTYPSTKLFFLYINFERKKSDGRVRNQMVAR